MAIPALQLFLDKFISFNQDRYKDDADILPIFTGLTLDDCDFDAVVKDGAGKNSTSLSSDTKNFTAEDQSWTSAKYSNPVVSTAVNAGTPAENIAALGAIDVPGFYLYLDADGTTVKGALVYSHDTDAVIADDAATYLIPACNYELTAADLDVDTDVGSVTVNADTIYEVLRVVRAAQAIVEIPATDYGDLL